MHNPASFPNMPSLKNTLLMASAAALVAVAAVAWAAWLQSPERAAWLRDEERLTLRQLIASERAELELLAAACRVAHLEGGTAFAKATCDFTRLDAELARERMAKIQSRLDALVQQGDTR
jgi:uncharacterized membrane protein